MLFLWLLLHPGCRQAAGEEPPAARAREIFASLCARCHGSDGRGDVRADPSITPPSFHDAAFQKKFSDADLARVIRQGKGSMPAFASAYDDEEITALVALVRSFGGKNP